MESMSPRDIEASFAGNWLGYIDTDGYVTPVFIDGPCDLDGGGFGMWAKPYDYSGESKRRKRVPMDDVSLVYSHPDSGYYYTREGECLWFSRRSGRQFQRGVRTSYVRVKKNGQTTGLDAPALHEVYNPLPFPTFEEAKRLITDKRMVPLSRMTAIENRAGYERPIILLRDAIIGEVSALGEASMQEGTEWLIQDTSWQ